MKRLSTRNFILIYSVITLAIPVTNGCKKEFKPHREWVLAEKGAPLLDLPDEKGKIIKTLAYGTEVKLLSESPETVEIYDTVIEEKIKGKWSKVRYKEQQGWIFGGYLGSREELNTLNARENICAFMENPFAFEFNRHDNSEKLKERLVKKFGEPQSFSAQRYITKKNQKSKNYIYIIGFDGVTFHVFHDILAKKQYIEEIELAGAGTEYRKGIVLNMSRKDIEKILGEPSGTEKGALLYYCRGDEKDRIAISFNEDRLSRINLNYAPKISVKIP